MTLRSEDFESSASTNFTTPASVASPLMNRVAIFFEVLIGKMTDVVNKIAWKQLFVDKGFYFLFGNLPFSQDSRDGSGHIHHR